jgi:hypothetical protein
VRRRRSVAPVVALAAVAVLVLPSWAAAALPAINYTLAGTAGANEWFVSPVTVAWSVNFQGTPVTSSGCEAAIAIRADTTGTTRTCSASNTEGTTTAVTRVIRIDTKPPVAAGAAAARPPDVPGFYRGPVGVTWAGTDAMSGIATCTSLSYAGPDGPASLSGTCTDKAGNVSAPLQFALSYDATPPSLGGVSAVGGDTVATVRWAAAADAQQVTVTRSPGPGGAPAAIVFAGLGTQVVDTGLSNGGQYTYSVTATDAAGNAATLGAQAAPVSRLVRPQPGARMVRPPLLRWKRLAHADYYNVQLFRGGRKILSSWPSRTRLRLHGAWRYGGHRHRLTPGTYRWYVWPGYGRRSRRAYGAVLGIRTFTIVGSRVAR